MFFVMCLNTALALVAQNVHMMPTSFVSFVINDVVHATPNMQHALLQVIGVMHP